jgi:hypothetical protein
MPLWLIQIVRHERLIHLLSEIYCHASSVCTDLSLVHNQITTAVSRPHSNYFASLAYRFSSYRVVQHYHPVPQYAPRGDSFPCGLWQMGLAWLTDTFDKTPIFSIENEANIALIQNLKESILWRILHENEYQIHEITGVNSCIKHHIGLRRSV